MYDFLSSCKQKTNFPFDLTKKRDPPLDPAKDPEQRRRAKLLHWRLDDTICTLLDSKSKEWSQTPSRFWEGSQFPSSSLQDPQHVVVLFCLQRAEDVTYARITRRISCLVLSRLRKSRTKNEGAEAIARAIIRFSLPQGDLKVLTASVRRVIEAGAKYDHIAQRLGIGSLFLLGNDVPDTTFVSSS